MAGKWTDIWDDDAKKWRKVYFDDWPEADFPGSVITTPDNEKDIVILGQDGKPLIKAPGRRIGF